MLRKRSRGTTSKQALMADSGSSPSSSDKYHKPTSFFSSPRLFTSFTSKCLYETESIMSPTSILDSAKPFSGFKNPFWSETNSPRTPGSEQKRYWDKLDSKVVGLGLVDALIDDKNGEMDSKPESRKILLGSQLKIQIPPLLPSVLSPSESLKSSSEFGIRTKNSQLSSLSPSESLKSSTEFGIKTRNSQLGSSTGSFSLSDLGKPVFGSENSAPENQNFPRVFTGCLSVSELELSEDYTRVISHGPNPRTVHIFDNCIIESSCLDVGFADSAKENGVLHDQTKYPSESFLSFCFYCKKSLGQGKDIYMYRGERAFCSRECRYQGMLLEEGIDNLEAENDYGSCS